MFSVGNEYETKEEIEKIKLDNKRFEVLLKVIARVPSF